ncbi:hydantoinase B/oxoprolinase family protein [Amycolatopsis panacis]|uniref:Hydantoinase B/oxoprolinase family protein n=1 Tax=Amycolatopsis panacis TaxID=2340917 RepID=A0A419HZK1_9PSEU|nr:hydantoinase B/oxoprolinase family protein [Amycolatopsis panacis]RJQ82693.1 hydantoinase B/oxoprolinase family protein [Amycolatopsis panacis]
MNPAKALDPFVVGAVSSRLSSVLQEQQTALVSTAFSSIVRESLDLACAVFDSKGDMIGQSVGGTPGHINAMATGMHHFVSAYPPETLEPGDVLFTNDPWMTAGQINDISVATPVFRDGVLVAWFATCCHAPDIGGRVLSAQASEVFEEGLAIPIMKLFRAGRPNADMIRVIRQNVRTPDETIGDLYAQASANAVGADSLLRLMDEYDLSGIDDIAAEIMSRSEVALRQAIRAVPDGVYRAEIECDGFDGEGLTLALALTVADGEVHLDFSGSSPESKSGVNVVLNYTMAYSSFAIKAAIAPDVPHNAGSFRPVSIEAPEGSILHCRRPAPVASRHSVGHYLPSLIFRALAQVVPDRVMAESADAVWMTVFRGKRSSAGPFLFSHFLSGGAGARSGKDGLSTTSFPSGLRAVPTEVFENLTPMVQLRRELRTDSGGAGEFRGGLGQVTTFRSRDVDSLLVNANIERTRFAARGALGGRPGLPGFFGEDTGRSLKPKQALTVDPAVPLEFRPPGGGGFGDPRARLASAVLADVAGGYVSREAALSEYGVVVEFRGDPNAIVRPPEAFVLDEDATREARSS